MSKLSFQDPPISFSSHITGRNIAVPFKVRHSFDQGVHIPSAFKINGEGHLLRDYQVVNGGEMKNVSCGLTDELGIVNRHSQIVPRDVTLDQREILKRD